MIRVLLYSLLFSVLFLFLSGCSKEGTEENIGVSLVLPENNGSVDYSSVTLQWRKPGDSESVYSVSYGTTNPPENKVNDVDGMTYTMKDLNPGTVYYWSVTVSEKTPFTSEVWKFTTIPAKKLELISPQNMIQVPFLYPLLKWDFQISEDTKFHVYLDSDTSNWREIGVTDIPTYLPRDLKWSTDYYWKVIVESDNNKTIQSPTWSFKTPAPSKQDYTSYKGLIMAGYQGWFAAEGDGSNLGWFHYTSTDGAFSNGYCSIDFWPDVSEYKNTYEPNFLFSNGNKAKLFSSYDEQTVLTHFKWMEEYGIDGVFMQRFMSEIKYRKERGYKVFANAMKGASMYHRAICLMYDGGIGTDDDLLKSDLLETNALYDFKSSPNYLKHNERPLVALWGIGFSGRPDATPEKTSEMIDWLHDQGFSVLLGVDSNWRTQTTFHDALKKADIIHPWFVGRYSSIYSYETNYRQIIKDDMAWCRENEVDYVPTVFPGFSWHNMYPDSQSDLIQREGGDFLWGQMYGNIADGAEMIYVAMFDEMDEGTCIFKCAQEVPKKPTGSPAPTVFVPYKVESDYYLWLTGEAARMLRKELSLTSLRPQR